MLCRMLKASGVAGAPASYFHRPEPLTWAAPLGLDVMGMEPGAAMRSICAAVLPVGRAGTPCFGLRLQGHSRAFFAEHLALAWPEHPGMAARIEAAFGRMAYIHLWRRDLLAQAISRVKAEQTGLWHRGSDGSEIERTAAPAPARYDPEKIGAIIDDLRGLDAGWRAWFAEDDLAPLSLCYEDVAADPLQALRDILDLLEIDPVAARAVSADTGRLSDAVSRDWHARYRADTAQSASAFML